MAQKFTIHDTVVTQKICSNHSWMKGISSYVYPFFLFKRGNKPTIADYIPPHMTIWLAWNYELKDWLKELQMAVITIPSLKENKLTLIQPAAISKEEL